MSEWSCVFERQGGRREWLRCCEECLAIDSFRRLVGRSGLRTDMGELVVG